MSRNFLTQRITLPCGVTLANRLVKSAMTERISNHKFEPTRLHEQLYQTWSETGAALLITGNVFIDRVHLESAGNVVFDDVTMLPKLQRWAAAGKAKGNHIWVQISHAGRQTNRFNTHYPLAPSSVRLNKMGLFGKPKAMTEPDIEGVINGFVQAAILAKQAGFTGIQIHSAHGYLLSQFLSPRTNMRTDRWGGSIENRSRLLQTIIQQVRGAVGKNIPVSVKLNSSDFQKGGLTENESLEVIKMLDREQIDLLEISGGTYEKLSFLLLNEEFKRESTKRREAYFIEFAKKVKEITKTPLLVTGGFRSFQFCNEVLERGELDLIGMGRPFITDSHAIERFLNGGNPKLNNYIIRTNFSPLDDSAEGGFYAKQLIRLAEGKTIKTNQSPLGCAMFLIWHEFKKAMGKKFYFRWSHAKTQVNNNTSETINPKSEQLFNN